MKIQRRQETNGGVEGGSLGGEIECCDVKEEGECRVGRINRWGIGEQNKRREQGKDNPEAFRKSRAW